MLPMSIILAAFAVNTHSSAAGATRGLLESTRAGSRPTFDNRLSQDTWNLRRIIAEHSGRADLIDHLRRQGAVLCDIADQLSEQCASVLVPSIFISNDALGMDQPVPLAGLIDGLAGNHIPVHAQQLLDLAG
jgi:hypothetical protein